MSRRRGEFSNWQLNSGWPYQVAVPALSSSMLTHQMPSECHRGHSVHHEGKEYLVRCFSDWDEAAAYLERMRGAWCSEEDRRKKRWKPDDAFLHAASLARNSCFIWPPSSQSMYRWGFERHEPDPQPVTPSKPPPVTPPSPHLSYKLPLDQWPWVTIKFRCDHCRRGGTARLARCAAKFGSSCTIGELLEKFVARCPRTAENRGVKPPKYGLKCTAYIDMRLELPPEALR